MAISMKVLKAEFGGMARKLADPEGALKAVRSALVAHDFARIGVEETLSRIDTALDAHGVEAIPDPLDEGTTIALYVNTGDPYNPTIVFSKRTRRFYATSWGDWYENSPEYSKYRKQEQEEENDY